MKITWKHGDRSIEFERKPVPEGRFRALCKLAGGVIGGAALLVAVRIVSAWAIGALVAVGFYKMLCKCMD